MSRNGHPRRSSRRYVDRVRASRVALERDRHADWMLASRNILERQMVDVGRARGLTEV